MSEQGGRYQRSASGMVGAMLVLFLVVTAFVVLRSLNRNDPDAAVRAVDYRPVVTAAREQVAFPVLAPPSLPEGWVATVARFTVDPDSWHLRMLTDERVYVGLEQSTLSSGDMVESYVDPEARRGGVIRVEGLPWREWSDDGGDTALVRTADGVTTVLVTTGDQQLLVDFVETLAAE